MTLMAEFKCWPLWQDTGSGRVNVDPGGFGIPADLVHALNAWADRFDRTYVLGEEQTRSANAARRTDACDRSNESSKRS